MKIASAVIAPIVLLAASAKSKLLSSSNDKSVKHKSVKYSSGGFLTCGDIEGFTECDYGTKFYCPFPFFELPTVFGAAPTCCENLGGPDPPGSFAGQRCVASGGYFLSRNDNGDDYYCCPKEMLSDYINNNCRGAFTHKDEECDFSGLERAVRLELVLVPEFEKAPDVACLNSKMIVCCPNTEITELAENNQCPG